MNFMTKEIKSAWLDKFIDQVLKTALRSTDTTSEQQLIVVDDIKLRLASYTNCSVPLQSCLRQIASEESAFWEPGTVDRAVKEIVALCVRNSMIEDLHCSVPSVIKHSKEQLIDENLMRSIMIDSCRWINEFGLDQPDMDCNANIYQEIPSSFPSAYKALLVLKNTNNRFEKYSPVPPNSPRIPIGISTAKNVTISSVNSGMSAELDSDLCHVLGSISAESPLFTDSFKSLTRNTRNCLYLS